MSAARGILLTGAPGSGKTTLGRQLSHLLRVPFLARDDVRGGLLFSAGAWGDELERIPSADEAVERFLRSAEQLLDDGVSCVLEYVWRVRRPRDLQRILAVADCVVVMTSCADPTARVRRRNATDRLIASPAVLRAVGFESVDAHTESVVMRMEQVAREMRTDFPVPTLHVDTTDGYLPAIDDILAFATGEHRRRDAPSRP